jgi:branched-chain amino acid transport system substrate-binding protein
MPIVGPWTLSQQSFIDKAGASAEGVRTSVTFIENDLSPVSTGFSLFYRKINKVNIIPSPIAAAQTYDAITENMVYMGEIHNGKVVYAYKEDANRGLIVRTKIAQYLGNIRLRGEPGSEPSGNAREQKARSICANVNPTHIS